MDTKWLHFLNIIIFTQALLETTYVMYTLCLNNMLLLFSLVAYYITMVCMACKSSVSCFYFRSWLKPVSERIQCKIRTV